MSNQVAQAMHHVPPGEGPCVGYTGQTMHVKVSTAESGGELSVIELAITAGNGTPLHVHERENEAYYVLEGDFEFVCGDRTVDGGAGTLVHAPRGVPHRFQNVGTGNGRLLMIFTPGGIETYFAEIAAMTDFDPLKLIAIAERHGITVLQTET